MCRFNPNVLPWSFGLFVFLTMLLDFGSGNAAREMAEWMASVSSFPADHAKSVLKPLGFRVCLCVTPLIVL